MEMQRFVTSDNEEMVKYSSAIEFTTVPPYRHTAVPP